MSVEPFDRGVRLVAGGERVSQAERARVFSLSVFFFSHVMRHGNRLRFGRNVGQALTRRGLLRRRTIVAQPSIVKLDVHNNNNNKKKQTTKRQRVRARARHDDATQKLTRLPAAADPCSLSSKNFGVAAPLADAKQRWPPRRRKFISQEKQ